MQAVQTMAKRTKLLRQARTHIDWSDWVYFPLAAMFFFLAYQFLQGVEAHKSYDISKLTPMNLLSPALYFALGLTFLNQVFTSAAVRRLNALVHLLDPSEQR